MRPLLRAQGHEVSTPSLTGIGERVHLASSQVTLSTHIRDVVNHVLYEDLNDIVLVGFSYGGAVVTGALRHIGDRVRHLVYLDAFVPAHGESIDALRGASGESRIELGDDWQIAPRSREFDDPAEGAWQLARRVAQPAGTFSEAVGLDHPLEEWPFTRTYIKATADPNDADGSGAFWQAAIRAKASPFWRYEEVATNHLVPANRPAELVAILTSLTPTG